MEVHRRLGHAGGAGREGEEAGVVGGGVDGGEGFVVALHRGFEAAVTARVEQAQVQRRRRQAQFVGQRRIAQCMRDPADVDDRLQLLGAQQRHRRHRDRPGLHHGEPAGGQHRVVRRAQQHAVAGHDAHVLHQHLGDAIGTVLQVAPGPGQTGRADADPLAAALRNRCVEQLDGAVQLRGELQLGQLEQKLRLLIGRRQVVAGEGVDVGAGHGYPFTSFSSSRAMINCCTSVAPS